MGNNFSNPFGEFMEKRSQRFGTVNRGLKRMKDGDDFENEIPNVTVFFLSKENPCSST